VASGVRSEICTAAEQALRDQFRLERWIKKSEDTYFTFCDWALPALSRINRRHDPGARSFVRVVAGAVSEDDEFRRFALSRGSTFLTDDSAWERLYRACACTIIEAYFSALAKSKWP
jgi:hypothetical protein